MTTIVLTNDTGLRIVYTMMPTAPPPYDRNFVTPGQQPVTLEIGASQPGDFITNSDTQVSFAINIVELAQFGQPIRTFDLGFILPIDPTPGTQRVFPIRISQQGLLGVSSGSGGVGSFPYLVYEGTLGVTTPTEVATDQIPPQAAAIAFATEEVSLTPDTIQVLGSVGYEMLVGTGVTTTPPAALTPYDRVKVKHCQNHVRGQQSADRKRRKHRRHGNEGTILIIGVIVIVAVFGILYRGK